MSESTTPGAPSFADFTRWLADRKARENSAVPSARYSLMLSAAQRAREETLRGHEEARSVTNAGVAPTRHFEVLQLMAAASEEHTEAPPELTTARGFRVTLAYEEGRGDAGAGSRSSSICVLVRCPPELIGELHGKTAFLWNGSERFELGQFDAEGKAIGTLPAGIEISLMDFTQGRVKLEEPPPEKG